MSRRPGAIGRVHRLRAEVQALIDSLLEEPAAAAHDWQPPVDLVEHADHFALAIDLPGLAARDVEVELCGPELTVRGHKGRAAAEAGRCHFHLVERFMGPFEVVVELPQPVQPAAARAHLARGVLRLELPKVRDQRQRRYTITIDEEKSPDD